MNTAPANPPVLSRAECRSRLARNLTRILSERGLTAVDAASKAGVCYRVVQRAARGESDPSLSIMFSLAKTVGVKLEKFLDGGDEPPRKRKKRS